MFDEGEYYYSATDVWLLGCHNDNYSSIKKKKKMMKKRRFSNDQVRMLECIFENETKLEPHKKVEVAKELGLQPRQVAIWFQNKRARYKSKQLETDYSILRANYNALSSQFESLKKEKNTLFLQLKKLKEEVSGIKEEESEEKSFKGEEKAALSMEGSEHEHGGSKSMSMSMLSSSCDEGSSENTNTDNNNFYLEIMERETDQIDEITMLTTTLPDEWDQYMFDQHRSDQWWDFWS